MAQTTRVGVIGLLDGNGEDRWSFGQKYGVEVFDLTTEQICSLLENPDAEKSVQSTRPDFPAPVMSYSVMGGGRLFPSVSREELTKTIEGVEMLVSRMSTKAHFNFFGYEFFETLFMENESMSKCNIVVARVVGEKRTYRERGRTRTVKTEDFVRNHGLHIKQFAYKGKFFVITDKSRADSGDKKKTKKLKKNEVNISRVRSELAGEELKGAITQPVKETITAGKAIVGLGARLGQWFSSLVKTQ